MIKLYKLDEDSGISVKKLHQERNLWFSQCNESNSIS